MRGLIAAVVVVHGLIHLMGFAKAFGLAELPQLTQPIPRGMGVLWLLAGVAVMLAGVLFVLAPRVWWMVGLGAAALSQAVIFTAWGDAKVGTLANVALVLLAIYGLASEGPWSLRAEYRAEVAGRADTPVAGDVLTERDLIHLPPPVQRYLRVTGSVGQPRPRRFSAKFRGRIRGTADEPWMEFTAEQHSFLDEPARFFRMEARRGGLPVDVLHAFRGGAASMRVRLLSMVPLVDARGPEATLSETVTLLNDLCLFAPGALVDPAIRWEAIDESSARAAYTLGPNTVSAVLEFNEVGELVDFVSEDRGAASEDGARFVRQRWSTPLREYRAFGTRRAASLGEGWWHPPGGAFAYIELEVLDLVLADRTMGQ